MLNEKLVALAAIVTEADVPAGIPDNVEADRGQLCQETVVTVSSMSISIAERRWDEDGMSSGQLVRLVLVSHEQR